MLLAFIVALQTVGSGPVIGPGDRALRVNRVHLGVDTQLVVVQPKVGPLQIVATLYRTIDQVERNGSKLIRESHFYDYGNQGTEYDTLEVDARTLQMVRIVEIQGQDRNELTYDGKRLTGVVSTQGSSKQVDATPAPFFHDMMDDSFTGMYPLDSLFTFRVREIRPPDVAAREVQFRTVGRDSIRTTLGLESTMVVKRDSTVTMWVSRADGRLLRLRVDLPNGVVAWRLPKRDLGWIQPGKTPH